MYLTLKSGIAKPNRLCYNTHRTGMWLSWLARFAHIEEVGGSSPSIPTKSDRVLDTIHQEPYRFLCPVFSLFAYTFFEAEGASRFRFGGFLSFQKRFLRPFRRLFRKAIVSKTAIVSFSDYRFTIVSGIEKARSSALRAMLSSNAFRYSRDVFEQKLSSSVRVDRELLD